MNDSSAPARRGLDAMPLSHVSFFGPLCPEIQPHDLAMARFERAPQRPSNEPCRARDQDSTHAFFLGDTRSPGVVAPW